MNFTSGKGILFSGFIEVLGREPKFVKKKDAIQALLRHLLKTCLLLKKKMTEKS